MKKRKWFFTLIIVMILCGLIGTAIAAFVFLKTPEATTVASTIEFTFIGAADAVAPNGLAFDISDLSSDTVLSTALEKAGLNTLYTPDQVRSSLTVSGQYPDDLLDKVTSFTSLINYDSSQSNLLKAYHPTSFRVVLDNRFDPAISETSQTALLEAITSSYFDFFKKTYGASLNLHTLEAAFDLSAYDYIQQLEIIEQQINTVSRYSLEMYRIAPTFRLNGVTFDDISVRLQNLTNSTISQLSSNMFLNAIAKNPQRLLNQYQFTLRNLVYEQESKQQYLTNLTALIDSFERNGSVYMSANNAFTEIDGNSSETYAQLSTLKTRLTNEISNISAEIAANQMRMNDMKKNQSASTTAVAAVSDTETASNSEAATDEVLTSESENLTENIEAAEGVTGRQVGILQRQINSIIDDRNKIISDFETMLTTYNDQQINSGTVTVSATKYVAPSLISFAFIIQAIKISLPICFFGFVLCIVFILPGLKKHYSWQNLG